MTRMDIPLLLGTAFTDRRGPGERHRLRASTSPTASCSRSPTTASSARSAMPAGCSGRRSGSSTRSLAGGVLVTVLLPAVHPRMGTPWTDAEETPLLEAPGFLLLNYGRRTASGRSLATSLYGAIVGGFAARPRARCPRSRARSAGAASRPPG